MTNEELLAAARTRISRRTYLDEPLSPEELALARSLCEEYTAASDARFQLVEDGAAAFASARKSYGMFRGVRSLVLVKVAAGAGPSARAGAGYFGEKIVLELAARGLGTCWVGGTFDRAALPVGEGEELLCVITVGHVGVPTLRERALRRVVSTRRKSAAERLETDGSVDTPLLWEGLEALRLAPSAVNAQSVKVLVREGKVSMMARGDAPYEMLDLGIATLHFELGSQDSLL